MASVLPLLASTCFRLPQGQPHTSRLSIFSSHLPSIGATVEFIADDTDAASTLNAALKLWEQMTAQDTFAHRSPPVPAPPERIRGAALGAPLSKACLLLLLHPRRQQWRKDLH
jgi:hypothetical protein